MTGREQIRSRTGIWGILALPVMLGFVVAVCWAAQPSIPAYVLLLVVACCAMFLLWGVWIGIRTVCPFCGGWIAPLFRFASLPFNRGLPAKVRFCPLCGRGFDEDLKEK